MMTATTLEARRFLISIMSLIVALLVMSMPATGATRCEDICTDRCTSDIADLCEKHCGDNCGPTCEIGGCSLGFEVDCGCA